MTIQIAITPPIAGINADKLRAELVAVYADVTGISSVKGSYYVNLITDSLTTQQQLQEIVDVHNPAILTAAQQQQQADSNERATLLSLADGALLQIANDKTALAAAGSLAAVRPIIENILTRQDREIRALRAIIRNGLN